MMNNSTKKIRELSLTKSEILRMIGLTLIISMLAFSSSHAQDTQLVTGKVIAASDNTGIPLANVIIKGSTRGTATDVDGNFSIEATSSDVLVFSYIGYETKEIPVGSNTVVNVTLIEDITKLNELVVVGYGTTKRSDLTGAVSSVKGETINQTVTTGIDQGLIGRVAGVTATQMSGQPGGSVSIRIRGISSINGELEPLYVIDGVPIDANNGTAHDLGLEAVGGNGKTTYSPLSTINPNDIETIDILKDASATAIYGNRGSNGVVIITTKRGKKGDARIGYNMYYGMQELPTRLEMMNMKEYAEFRNDWAAETSDEKPDPALADPSLLGEGTDWQGEIFKVAPLQNHQLTLSGGSEKMRYLIGAGYFYQDGMIIGSEFKRYSLRINLDSDIKKWLTIGNSLAISKTDERLGRYDGGGGIILTALKARPDYPSRNFDGTYAGVSGEGAFINPLAQALDFENYLKRYQILGNFYADVKIFPSLTFRTEIGGNGDLGNSSVWKPTFNYGGGATNDQNSISRQSNTGYFWQFKNYLTFNKSIIDVHNITAMIGQEASEWGGGNIAATGRGLKTNDVPSIGLGDPLKATASDAFYSSSLASYYGRLNYNYSQKYFLTFTYRADGSSNFGPGRKWGYFPSAAVAWKLYNEPFLSAIKPIVSDLKLRAGWGITGNSGSSGFRYGESLSTSPTGLGMGFRTTNFGNPAVTWEEAHQIDIGLNTAFLNNRIEFSFDYYRKLITGLLFETPLPGYMGTIGNQAVIRKAPWGNFGEMENKGFEIELKTRNLTGELKWETDINFTRNINTLKDLGIDAPLYGSIGNSGNVVIAQTLAGQELGSFYGYKVAGIFVDSLDIINSPVQWSKNKVDPNGNPVLERGSTVWPGDLKFVDIDKNDTIDIRDRTNLGSPQAKFSFGINNNFSYKGFELGIFLVGTYGNKIFNAMKNPNGGGLADMRSGWSNQLKEVTERAKLEPIGEATGEWWNDADNVRVSNPNTNIPRATYSDPNQNTRVSDRYIEDGSFLRIRNIVLAYNFSPSWIGKFKMTGLRVEARAQNVYTFTKYTGYDPEIGQDSNVAGFLGVDLGRYPSPRMYTLGLSVNF